MVTSNVHQRPAPAGQRAIRYGNAASLIGAIAFVLSAATMVFLYIRMLFAAMGWIGFILGLISAPVAVAYPFMEWLSTDDFPAATFSLWLAGVVGMAMTMTWAAWGRYRAASPRAHTRGRAGVLAAEETD